MRASRRGRNVRIDKPTTRAVKWPRSTVSHVRANRECGEERKFRFRSCPRNCKRRARTTEPLGRSREGGDGQRPASQETCRRYDCWPGGGASDGVDCIRHPGGALRGGRL